MKHENELSLLLLAESLIADFDGALDADGKDRSGEINAWLKRFNATSLIAEPTAPTIGTEPTLPPLDEQAIRDIARIAANTGSSTTKKWRGEYAAKLKCRERQLASAIAERDKAIKLLREYRRMHEYKDVFEHQNDSETCSTCQKLDASGLLGGK